MTEEKFLKELTEWYREPIDGMKTLTQITFTPYQLLQFIEQVEKNNFIKPDVSGQLPPMFIRWCISKKIEVYSGDAIGITSMSDNGMFPVVSAERLFEIFMEETGGNLR